MEAISTSRMGCSCRRWALLFEILEYVYPPPEKNRPGRGRRPMARAVRLLQGAGTYLVRLVSMRRNAHRLIPAALGNWLLLSGGACV